MPEKAEFDVLIVGSGFGGSVAANRLVMAGQRILLLERGPWRDSLPTRSMGIERRAPFPYGIKAFTHLLHSVQWGRLRLPLNRAGMFELFAFPGLYVLTGSAVGGGSTAYGGLLEAPRNGNLWSGRHAGLEAGSIERYYAKIIDDLGGVRLSSAEALPQSVWTHLPAEPGRLCRPTDPQPHMALLMPPSAAEAGKVITTAAGVQRSYCALDGDSFLGSRGGAKASVDFVYLAPVLGDGCQVRDLCEVTSVRRARPVDGDGYLVSFTDRSTGGATTVQAKQVVLAAGTMNTLRLLFGGAGTPGGLTPMPALGRNFSANGDLMGVWSRTSAPASSFTSTPSLGAFDVAGHGSITFGLGGFPGFQTLPLPSVIKRRLERIFFIYGMGADSGGASVSSDHGHLHCDYDQRREPVYEQVRAAFRLLSDETGDPSWSVRTPVTVHPGGGACLGPDAEHGVVDHRGEVYGNPGLFVADGAALPAAVGGPPSLAIAAWAHHVAEGMVPPA